MLRRPKVGETEEDLLKQEEEFLKESGKTPTQKSNPEVNPDEIKSSTAPGVVGEVVERDQGLPCATSNGSETKTDGFPAPFKIDPKIQSDKEGKKSLFALHMEKNKKTDDKIAMDIDALNLSSGETGPSTSREETGPSTSREEPGPSTSREETGPSTSREEPGPSTSREEPGPSTSREETGPSTSRKEPGPSTSREETGNVAGSMENRELSDDDKRSVHLENLNKLSEMPEVDILEAQRKLHETLDPKLISVLKKRPKAKENADVDKKGTRLQGVKKRVTKTLSKDEKIKATLRNYVGDKWVNMDFIEKEKLEWVGDIPNSDTLEPDQPYSARFDFKGELQPFRTEIDVTNALYHHGDEPERPGYTIQELYQLSRSAVLQQRKLALKALANIIHKAKLGYYDVCFDGHLLHKLIEADLFLLLRFSIDKNALIPSAMNCLRMLLYNDSDEYCLDRLSGITDEDVQPLLSDKLGLKKEEERELTDNKIIQLDLIKGVMRTDLLTRITYILNHLPCKRETVANAMSCFIRVARHSSEACDRVARTPDLLHFVYSNINSDEPVHQAVKLFRVLTGQSRDAAIQMASRYPLDFLAMFLNIESKSGTSKRELYLLKLECVYLWRNFIRCGLMKDDFIGWTPCCVRTLLFYVEKVNIYDESDFDFELFSGLVSLLRFCVRDKLPIDSHYPSSMYSCFEKWMNQLVQTQKFTYAGLKALGSVFAFLIDYFGVFGAEGRFIPVIRKYNRVISSLINSPCFEQMASRLLDYSHMLVAKAIERDPPNLPSLCSVYENGDDFVRIVKNQSTLPFFMNFVKYLQFCYVAVEESKTNIELFTNNPTVRKYITEIMKLEKNTGNWFERYEITLLSDILQLLFTAKDNLGLKLGFRLMPMIRVDDEDLLLVLPMLTDKKNWGSDEDFFDSLSDIYVDVLFNPEMRNGYAMRYRYEAAGEDWPYKVLPGLRGRDDVVEVKKALRYLTMLTWNEPQLIERISFTARYYHLCSVFLTDANVFDEDIQGEMRCNFRCVLQNREKVDLTMKVNKKKSFYDLYTELITQYAGVSYGMHIFAEFVLFPLQNRFDISFRKLLWFEYLHVLRVITVPYPSSRYINVEEFIEPFETDESLLVAYLNSISSNVISKQKNPFVYNLAVSNLNNYMRNASPDSTLYNFLSRRIRFTISEKIKQDLVSW